MRILNFGSLNLDYIYSVEAIALEGQTIDSHALDCQPGGKGLNQSVAIARAGGNVYHAGMIGTDGQELKKILLQDKVDCTYVREVSERTGNAIIQVDAQGKNSIILFGGANRKNDIGFCDEVLQFFDKGDILLLQNEINCVDYLISKGHEKGMYVVLNPSPMNQTLLECSLHKVSLFVLNEHEAAMITGKNELNDILQCLEENYGNAEVVLTLGAQGSIYRHRGICISQKAFTVSVVDTTGAGDTFLGYFLVAKAKGYSIEDGLALAAKAAALAVVGKGAAPSIPFYKDVERAYESVVLQTLLEI